MREAWREPGGAWHEPGNRGLGVSSRLFSPYGVEMRSGKMSMEIEGFLPLICAKGLSARMIASAPRPQAVGEVRCGEQVMNGRINAKDVLRNNDGVC